MNSNRPQNTPAGGRQQRLDEALIDDSTWLAMGKDFITNTIPTLNSAAKHLGAAIGWFWSIYSAILLAATMLSGPSAPPHWALLVPVLTILAAYLTTAFASLPTRISFDPRSVEDIRRAYGRTAHNKLIWIYACVFFLVLSAVAIIGGLYVQYT